MKVIEVLKKACEYLQLYDEREYINKLQEYFFKICRWLYHKSRFIK